MRIEMHRFRSQRSDEIRCLDVARKDIATLWQGRCAVPEGFGGRRVATRPFIRSRGECGRSSPSGEMFVAIPRRDF